MNRPQLAQILHDIWLDAELHFKNPYAFVKGNDVWACMADYVLNTFVAKEAVKEEQATIHDLRCELEKWKALKTNVFSQDSKPRECETMNGYPICKDNPTPPSICPKPTMPDVPEKITGLEAADLPTDNEKFIWTKINMLIDRYSALKNVVERGDIG